MEQSRINFISSRAFGMKRFRLDLCNNFPFVKAFRWFLAILIKFAVHFLRSLFSVDLKQIFLKKKKRKNRVHSVCMQKWSKICMSSAQKGISNQMNNARNAVRQENVVLFVRFRCRLQMQCRKKREEKAKKVANICAAAAFKMPAIVLNVF